MSFVSRLVSETGRSYFPIALIARLPFAMMVVGVLTLIVSARGSVALGGATSAMVGVGTALFGSFIGAAADRYGQRPVLLICGIANSIALLAITIVAYSDAPDGVVLGLAVLIGSTAPQVAPMSRARLLGIIGRSFDETERGRATNGTMAYESAADELVFIFGPFIVGLLATTMNPAAPMIGAAALALIFVLAFALHPSGRTARAADTGTSFAQAPARELFRPQIFNLLLGVLGMGLFFGAMLTSLTSFMQQRGAPEQAGLLYGIMGIGSAILALSAAFFPDRFTLKMRWLLFGTLLFAGTLGLLLVHDTTTMGIVLALAGIGVGPTLVTQFSIAAELSPRGRNSTIMTMMGSSLVLGQSAASAITGLVAENSGPDAALLLPIGSAGVVLLAGILNTLFRKEVTAVS